jgi:hypothetical protein
MHKDAVLFTAPFVKKTIPYQMYTEKAIYKKKPLSRIPRNEVISSEEKQGH